MGILASLGDWLDRRREAMECRAAVELMTDYLEGALDPRMHNRFETHLADCPACTAYLDQMRATIATTGKLREEDIEPATRDRLLEAFRGFRTAS